MLEVNQLSKRFSRSAPPALTEVSFSVSRGEICGLLGHNGAGKSTAIGTILGLVYPDRGEVLIDGCSVQKNRETALRKVGAIFEAPSFYNYLSGWKNLKVLTAYSGKVSKSELEEVVEWVGLSKRIHHKVETYSHGMRQRLGLAQALVPRPEFLLLDEPTDGLDPEGIVEFRERLLELRERLDLTVLLSSHLLTEVDQVCDKAVIIRGGRKVFEGSGAHLADTRVIYKICADNADEKTIATAVREKFTAEYASGVGISCPNEVDAAELLRYLVNEKQFSISEFTPMRENLESVYLNLSKSDREAK